jgi:hypothetical protein
MTKNFNKITKKTAKNIFLIKKLHIYLALGLKDVKATVQEKPSGLKRKHPPLENISFLNFYILWVLFALLDPDPSPHSLCESGSFRPKSVRIRIRNPAARE